MNGFNTPNKIILTLALIFPSLFFPIISYAVGEVSPGVLPGSVEPGVISNTLSASPIEAGGPAAAAVPQAAQQSESALGPQAAQIKFKLNQIIIEGNQVYSEADLLPLYKNKLNTTISIADLEGIVQNITNYYRNNGYILSRAVLPPQHVANGIVHIRIIEGYIDQVRVAGNPKGAKYILTQYGERISASRPVKINVMEHYLRLANEIPGASVRAVLEPAKQQGASDLNLVTDEKTLSGYISYDDYGTLYIGPQQITANINANSIFRSGDSTHLSYVRTSRPWQLQYYDFSNETPLGGSGLRGTLGVNNSKTKPGYFLEPLEIQGNATNIYGLINYPIVRSRDKDINITGGANYINSRVNALGEELYDDQIRSVKIGANYNGSDRFYGSNLLSGFLEQGLNIFGASNDPNSTKVSRFGASAIYTKATLNAGRMQQLFWRFSTFIYGTGQYSFSPLLASPQFAFGGSQLGRAYDPAELIGDRGAAGSVELRMDLAPGWYLLQTMQPYLFYDAGVIWNLRNIPNIKQKVSATSTGFGIRVNFTKNFSGNFMMTQPLTKQIAAYELKGAGRKPRGFFSIVASA